MKFSIIVPNYNTDMSLITKSLKAQTFKDFEVIVVDDGSVKPIVSEFSVIRQANGGPGKARATGLACAKGDYVLFMDADDDIFQDTLEIFGQHDEDVIYSEILEVGKNYTTQRNAKRMGCVYGVAYKRDFLLKNNITFAPLMQMEDVSFNTIVEYHNPTRKEIKQVTYKYIVTQGSITQTRDHKKTAVANMIKANLFVYDHTKDPYMTVKYLPFIFYNFMAVVDRMTEQEIREIFSLMYEWERRTGTIQRIKTDTESRKLLDIMIPINKEATIRQTGKPKDVITIEEFIEIIGE